MAKIELNIEDIKEELRQRDILDIQKKFIYERSTRMVVMTTLLSALLFTIVYGTIQNPFVFTFSKIGNRFSFGNRVLFIVWAAYTGFVILSSILALFRLENYTRKRDYTYILIAVIFLTFASFAPSLEEYPFWTWVHIVTAGLFSVFITLGFYPFIIWVARENPRLRITVYIWLSIIWGGGFLWIFLLGNTGVFEIWFFSTFIIFLLYLSLTLFEEKIVKTSVLLLRDEKNLNQGIEKYFIDLDKLEKKNK